MPLTPLGYSITFATHGHILRGRSVTPAPVEEGILPYLLDEERRSVVLATILEVCEYRLWEPLAIHVRMNQIHAVLDANVAAERAIDDIKAYCDRRLEKKLREPRKTARWAAGGNAFHAFDPAELREEIEFVLRGHGEPMAVFDAGET